MSRVCQCPRDETQRRRTRRSRPARRRKDGRSSTPRMPRRTRTRAGRRGTTRASMATRTMSAWTRRLIRKWDATDAAVHDSQKLDDVLDLSNTDKKDWAASAYRSVQIEAGLKAKALRNR